MERAGKRVDGSRDRVRWRWKRPGVETRAVRDGGEARAVRGRGQFLAKKLLPQPHSSASRIPGLASVPRSHRHLQPPAPAHVGPEAGGAPGTLSLIPQLLRGDPQPCRRVAAGAALCCPLVRPVQPVGAEPRKTVCRRRPDLDACAACTRRGYFSKDQNVSPGSRDISVGCVALRSSRGSVWQEDT